MEPFWTAACQGKLVVQRCDSCGHARFPAAPVCPQCLSSDQSWTPASGGATLLSWAVFHHGYWPAVKEHLPYDVCVVRLDEGPVLASNFATGCEFEPRVGLPLQVRFEAVSDTLRLPRFAPA